jgi:hypothetical protein
LANMVFRVVGAYQEQVNVAVESHPSCRR